MADLSGLRILVVEDSVLVAEDLSQFLIESGARVVGPFYQLDEAWGAAHEEMDLALLDVDVDGEPIWGFANHLRLRGVPLVLTTGFSGLVDRPEGFVDHLTVNKPYNLRELNLAILSAVGRGAQ